MIKTTSIQIDEKSASRFNSRAKRINGDCVEWGGFIDRDGYGRFSVNKVSRFAHRIAWVMANGDIPDGLLVCHTCDNRKCVNPAHLFLGTASENGKNAGSKRRICGTRGEKHGRAKLTEEDVKAIRLDTRILRVIAEAYGVSNVTIFDVKTFKNWKHVAAVSATNQGGVK